MCEDKKGRYCSKGAVRLYESTWHVRIRANSHRVTFTLDFNLKHNHTTPASHILHTSSDA